MNNSDKHKDEKKQRWDEFMSNPPRQGEDPLQHAIRTAKKSKEETLYIKRKPITRLDPKEYKNILEMAKVLARSIVDDIPGIKLEDIVLSKYEEYDESDIKKGKWYSDKVVYVWSHPHKRASKQFKNTLTFALLYHNIDLAYVKVYNVLQKFLRKYSLQEDRFKLKDESKPITGTTSKRISTG